MTEPALLLRAALALAAVLALVWLAARVLRRSPLAAQPGARLQLAESLALDPRRRLVLARCDGREVLLLLGQGNDVLVGWLPRPEDACAPR